MIPACRCGAPPESFESDRTGQFVVRCANPDCAVTSVSEDTPEEAVEAWRRLVS